MFGLSTAACVYLAKEPADMRKSFDALAAHASGTLGLDPLSGHLFVVVNKRRDRIKILYWDRDGLVVWAKRVERGTRRLPDTTGDHVEMTTAELAELLAGIDLDSARRHQRYSLPGAGPQDSAQSVLTRDHMET